MELLSKDENIVFISRVSGGGNRICQVYVCLSVIQRSPGQTVGHMDTNSGIGHLRLTFSYVFAISNTLNVFL